MYQDTLFNRFAKLTSRTAGHPATFAAAVLIILVWATSGPIFGFSNTWQLAINTGTTIITFLMVFLIQNTQNRDGAAVQLKLDELIRAIDGAHNGFLDLEELSDEDLARLRAHFETRDEDAPLKPTCFAQKFLPAKHNGLALNRNYVGFSNSSLNPM